MSWTLPSGSSGSLHRPRRTSCRYVESNLHVGLWALVLRILHRRNSLLIFCFDVGRRIEVTDGEHGHQIRSVPITVKALDRRDGRAFDDLGLSDRVVRRIAGGCCDSASALSAQRALGPRRRRHSSSTTPRSLSTSLGSNVAPSAKSRRTEMPVPSISGLSVGTWSL